MARELWRREEGLAGADGEQENRALEGRGRAEVGGTAQPKGTVSVYSEEGRFSEATRKAVRAFSGLTAWLQRSGMTLWSLRHTRDEIPEIKKARDNPQKKSETEIGLFG